MKKFTLIVSCLLLFGFLNTLQAQTKEKWKELENFHEVMSETFHPSEEGNLVPIKNRSLEMLQKAIIWRKSTPPAGYDKKAVKKHLKNLVKGSKSLHKLIMQKGTNQQITESLSKLHDVFHEVAEKCESKEHH